MLLATTFTILDIHLIVRAPTFRGFLVAVSQRATKQSGRLLSSAEKASLFSAKGFSVQRERLHSSLRKASQFNGKGFAVR